MRPDAICGLLSLALLASCQTTGVECHEVQVLPLPDGTAVIYWHAEGAETTKVTVKPMSAGEETTKEMENLMPVFHTKALEDGDYEATVHVAGKSRNEEDRATTSFTIKTDRDLPPVRFVDVTKFGEETALSGIEALVAVPPWTTAPDDSPESAPPSKSRHAELRAVALGVSRLFFNAAYLVTDAEEITGIQQNRWQVILGQKIPRQALAARCILVVDMRLPREDLKAQLHVSLYDFVVTQLEDGSEPIKIFEAYQELDGFEASATMRTAALVRGVQSCLREIAGERTVRAWVAEASKPDLFKNKALTGLKQALGVEIVEADLSRFLLPDWSEQATEPEEEEIDGPPAEDEKPRDPSDSLKKGEPRLPSRPSEPDDGKREGDTDELPGHSL